MQNHKAKMHATLYTSISYLWSRRTKRAKAPLESKQEPRGSSIARSLDGDYGATDRQPPSLEMGAHVRRGREQCTDDAG